MGDEREVKFWTFHDPCHPNDMGLGWKIILTTMASVLVGLVILAIVVGVAGCQSPQPPPREPDIFPVLVKDTLRDRWRRKCPPCPRKPIDWAWCMQCLTGPRIQKPDTDGTLYEHWEPSSLAQGLNPDVCMMVCDIEGVWPPKTTGDNDIDLRDVALLERRLR